VERDRAHVAGAALPELFAAQVARTPDADAVVFVDERRAGEHFPGGRVTDFVLPSGLVPDVEEAPVDEQTNV